MKPINTLPQTEDDLGIQRRRLVWLIGLRWYAAGSIIPAVLAGYALGMKLPVLYLLSLSACMFAYNYFFYVQVYKPVFNKKIAFQQTFLDVIVLSLILFLTGGFQNPFFTFYFFQVIIAWIILSYRESLLMTGFITLCFALQGLAPSTFDVKTSEQGLLNLGELPFHVIGAPVSFVITTVITAYFVYIIMGDLRKRERQLGAARQHAELELKKLDNILSQLGAGMLVINRQQQIDWLNDRIKEWFGSEGADETIACYRVSRIAKDLLSSTEKHVLLRKKRQFYYTLRLPILSQEIRDFEVVITPVCDRKGGLFQIIELVLDVTEQKKQQEQWFQAQRLAAIGQLAAGVAHEINTPLGTISILADEAREILNDHVTSETHSQKDELADALVTIHDQTRRCKNITQSLLNISRKPEYQKKTHSPNDIVRSALELAKRRIDKITVEEILDENLPEIYTDVSGVERTVFNLLLNAADAVENNGGDKHITVKTSRENNRVTIQVEDNGEGIREEDVSHVFEPFFTTKSVGKGTGLGLYVSYETIRDLGGSLELESKKGEGTKAIIQLPIDHDYD